MAFDFFLVVGEADIFYLCSLFECGRAAFDLEVFDNYDRVTIRENSAVAVFCDHDFIFVGFVCIHVCSIHLVVEGDFSFVRDVIFDILNLYDT